MGYIVSFVHSGEHAVFYRPDEQGYTEDINEAGLYALDKGLEIQKNTHNENRWIPISDILPKTKKVVAASKVKNLSEEELFAAKLYDFLLKTELQDSFKDEFGWIDGQEYFGYEIVDKPAGDRQDFEHEVLDDLIITKLPKDFEYIDYEYCDQQVNGGYTGDEYSGYLYFPLPNGKYLKCHYEC